MSKERDLLEQVLNNWDSPDSDPIRADGLMEAIREYLAKPSESPEALSVDLIMSSFASRSYGFKGDNWPCFSAGVRFAEKHHGIGGGDE